VGPHRPGNNDHDFYVTAGATTALVHNDNGGGCDDEQLSLFDDTPYRVEAPDRQYARVTLRSATKQAIQDAAPRDSDGNFIDPNTGQSIPKDGPFQYGHQPGFAQQQGWSREQFIEFENDPSHYQIEDPYNNMSHQYEQP
jgi:HNH/ENDO VII superfamily nuclease with conserved GHE residues